MKNDFETFVADSNFDNHLRHKLLLSKTQVLRLRKALANGSSANMKLSKTQLDKIGQSGAFLGWFLGSILKTGLVMKNVQTIS